MDLRKPHPLDYLFSALVSNRRVVSGFGLCVVASLVVLSCIVSVRTPPTISSSLFSWFDSVSDGVSHPESQISPGWLQVNERAVDTEKTHDGNPPKNCFTGREPGLEGTHEGNLAGDAKDSSFFLNREETLDGNLSASSGPDALKTPAGNLIVGGENSSDFVNSGLLGETHDENLSKGCSTGREPDALKSRVGNRTGKSNDTSNAVNAKNPLNRNHDGEPPTSPFTGSEPGSLTGDTKGSGIPVNAVNSSGKTFGQDASEDFYKKAAQSEKINEAGISSSNATSPSGGTVVVGRTQPGSTSEDHASGEGFKKKDGVDETDHGRNGVDGERKSVSRGSDQGGASERIREGAGENNRSGSTKRREGFYQTCDIYNGSWVRDERKPFYPAGSCPYIDDDFNCHKNGRPDDGFLRWRWQPYDCNIPRLNATDFLERLRGKRLIFVGDSLNRNMWESLVCILRDSVNDKSRVYEVAGRSEFKTKGYYAIRFEDYNCSVDFVRSPFLVQEVFLKNVNGSVDEKLRLDLLDGTTSTYREADVIVFNTGHWWTHEKTSRGIDYYQEGNYVYPVLKALEAYKRALSTWGRWVDKNINPNKTQVVFRGYSLTHFRGGQWNSGGQCHKETEPIFNDSFLAKYPSKMRALEWVLEQMTTPVIYLNVSRITDYRKDGHPSIYRKTYKTVEEQIAAEKSQDCSHWCLPGIPDTWNELLYASLLMDGQGLWRRQATSSKSHR